MVNIMSNDMNYPSLEIPIYFLKNNNDTSVYIEVTISIDNMNQLSDYVLLISLCENTNLIDLLTKNNANCKVIEKYELNESNSNVEFIDDKVRVRFMLPGYSIDFEKLEDDFRKLSSMNNIGELYIKTYTNGSQETIELLYNDNPVVIVTFNRRDYTIKITENNTTLLVQEL